MPIKKEIDESRQLTTFTVDGELDVDELTVHYKSFYEDDQPSMKMLWDFRSTTGGVKLSNERIEHFASFPKRYAHKRPEGKTAFVVKGDFGFGLGRMLSAFVELQDVKVNINVFHAIEDAIQWLEEDA